MKNLVIKFCEVFEEAASWYLLSYLLSLFELMWKTEDHCDVLSSPLCLCLSLSEHSLSPCYFSIPFSRSKAVFTAALIHSYHNFYLNFNCKLRILWFRPRTLPLLAFCQPPSCGLSLTAACYILSFATLCTSLFSLFSLLPAHQLLCVRERASVCVCSLWRYFMHFFHP